MLTGSGGDYDRFKKTNRTRILEFIFRNGPVARATIAEQTGITPATVTTTTASLIEEGIIKILGEEEDRAEVTPGRRRVLIDLNTEYAYAIGIEFNEKQISCCITDLRGKIVDKTIFSTTHIEITNITEVLVRQIEGLISGNESIANRLIGIGIGMPGKLDTGATGLIEESTTWKSFEPKAIKQRFRLPVIMDNNVKCMAYGQYLFSPQNTPETFSFFMLEWVCIARTW